MRHFNNFPWTKRVTLSAAVLCAAFSAHAQTITEYATGFDGTDTVNGTATAATYNSPNTPTDPLDGQNGWTTNDSTQTGTYGTSTQLVGRSDFVGTTGFYSAQTGVLGGVYRSTAPTGAAPDVVPSSSTGGVINLSHAVTIPSTSTIINLNVDFAVTPYVNFAHSDTFSLALQSATGVNLISFNFGPSAASPNTKDDISSTVGTTTTATGSQITLNGTYHLTVAVNVKADTFTASIVGTRTLNFSGSLAGASILPTGVGEFSTLWSLADKSAGSISNGGYQNAGDGYLIFDNLAVTVPEPSTYAMMAVGLVGLAGVLRLRRRQA